MQHLIRLSDAAGQHHVNLALDEAEVQRSALDWVFETLGEADVNDLVARKTVGTNQLDAFQALRREVFDRDGEGLFIRDGVSFLANGRELAPEAAMAEVFVPVEQGGLSYRRCELVVKTPESHELADQDRQMQVFAGMLFLHQIAVGPSLDVTKDYPELQELIAEAELKQWIEIDVAKAVYRLAPEGKRLHEAWMREAQDLIARFDIYADVELDSSGRASFDTGRGEDLRVPVLELSGLDPFRVRLLLGMSDGEWNGMPDWSSAIVDKDWYDGVFRPIEQAPSVEEIGRDRLVRVMDQAQAELRRHDHDD